MLRGCFFGLSCFHFNESDMKRVEDAIDYVALFDTPLSFSWCIW